MLSCFIFIKHLDEESCLSLSLDGEGQIVAPVAQRSFEEIRALQKNAQTIIVAPAERFGFYSVELPWLADKKARAALPYVLEEQIAENVEELHFAFDRAHYQTGRYLVVACKKIYLAELLSILHEHKIQFNSLTIDWFALEDHESCLTESGLLINNAVFRGSLACEFAQFYLQQISADQVLYTFKNISSPLQVDSAVPLAEDSSLWLARRLLAHKPINLCQGEFRQNRNSDITRKLYIAAASMTALWLLSVLIVNGLKIHNTNNQLAAVDSKIAQIYHQFFPQSKQVISPKFRIEQLLKSTQGNNNNAFWILLNQLTLALKDNSSRIEQLKYQSQILQVSLVSNDFSTLEALQNTLQKAHISVKQMQASTRDKKVLSTLELKL